MCVRIEINWGQLSIQRGFKLSREFFLSGCHAGASVVQVSENLNENIKIKLFPLWAARLEKRSIEKAWRQKDLSPLQSPKHKNVD